MVVLKKGTHWKGFGLILEIECCWTQSQRGYTKTDVQMLCLRALADLSGARLVVRFCSDHPSGLVFFFETLHFCIPQYCTQVTLIKLAIVYTFEGGLLSLLKFARINCLFVFVHGWLKKIAILNSEITF